MHILSYFVLFCLILSWLPSAIVDRCGNHGGLSLRVLRAGLIAPLPRRILGRLGARHKRYRRTQVVRGEGGQRADVIAAGECGGCVEYGVVDVGVGKRTFARVPPFE